MRGCVSCFATSQTRVTHRVARPTLKQEVMTSIPDKRVNSKILIRAEKPQTITIIIAYGLQIVNAICSQQGGTVRTPILRRF